MDTGFVMVANCCTRGEGAGVSAARTPTMACFVATASGSSSARSVFWIVSTRGVGEIERVAAAINPLLVLAVGVGGAVDALGLAPCDATLIVAHADANLVLAGKPTVGLELLVRLLPHVMENFLCVGLSIGNSFLRLGGALVHGDDREDDEGDDDRAGGEGRDVGAAVCGGAGGGFHP